MRHVLLELNIFSASKIDIILDILEANGRCKIIEVSPPELINVSGKLTKANISYIVE